MGYSRAPKKSFGIGDGIGLALLAVGIAMDLLNLSFLACPIFWIIGIVVGVCWLLSLVFRGGE